MGISSAYIPCNNSKLSTWYRYEWECSILARCGVAQKNTIFFRFRWFWSWGCRAVHGHCCLVVQQDFNPTHWLVLPFNFPRHWVPCQVRGTHNQPSTLKILTTAQHVAFMSSLTQCKIGTVCLPQFPDSQLACSTAKPSTAAIMFNGPTIHIHSSHLGT